MSLSSFASFAMLTAGVVSVSVGSFVAMKCPMPLKREMARRAGAMVALLGLGLLFLALALGRNDSVVPGLVLAALISFVAAGILALRMLMLQPRRLT